MPSPGKRGAVLELFKEWTNYLAGGIEGLAAILIGFAAIEAAIRAGALFLSPKSPPEAKEYVRLRLGRWLALALEFELGADILRTAIAPTWNEIGQLAAIIVLRTALNYFLQREIDQAMQRQALTDGRDRVAPGSRQREIDHASRQQADVGA